MIRQGSDKEGHQEKTSRGQRVSLHTQKCIMLLWYIQIDPFNHLEATLSSLPNIRVPVQQTKLRSLSSWGNELLKASKGF